MTEAWQGSTGEDRKRKKCKKHDEGRISFMGKRFVQICVQSGNAVEISSQLLHIDTWNSHFVWDALISSSNTMFLYLFLLPERNFQAVIPLKPSVPALNLETQQMLKEYDQINQNCPDNNNSCVLVSLKNYREMRTRSQFFLLF